LCDKKKKHASMNLVDVAIFGFGKEAASS